MISKDLKVLNLNPSEYPGGIAIWGALPAVYDTTNNTPESGIHVHARLKTGGAKVIDDTFDIVRVKLKDANTRSDTFVITADDAKSYNIGVILKKNLKYLRCPVCTTVHSDTGCHGITYHQQHQCQQCGVEFYDIEPSISNPIILLKELTGDEKQNRPVIELSERKLSLEQSELLGGVQIWGSNPAMLWTSSKLEESGIHIHGFRRPGKLPSIDETFCFVSIDGITLDAEMVRYLMAQEALPHIQDHLVSLSCPKCCAPHFDKHEMATIPHAIHFCESCNTWFDSPKEKLLAISNPLIDIKKILHSKLMID